MNIKGNRKISIIVPVYNVEKYIEKCITSVLSQTYIDWELLLINDGSIDMSGKICNIWSERDNRIKVIHQNNAGAATARNRGIEHATGKYIMFIDGDDYIESQMLENLYKKIVEDDSDCCICGYVGINEDGIIKYKNNVEHSLCFSGIEALRCRYLDNLGYVNIVNPWGKLYKRHVWSELRFTDGIYYEDLDVMPFLYVKCNKVSIVSYTGYYYLQREGSASHGTGTDEKRYTDSLSIRVKHINFYHEINERELEIEMIKKMLDLIITSDINGWIPASNLEYSKKIFSEYLIRLISVSDHVNIKTKIRYMLYKIVGSKIYRLLCYR